MNLSESSYDSTVSADLLAVDNSFCRVPAAHSFSTSCSELYCSQSEQHSACHKLLQQLSCFYTAKLQFFWKSLLNLLLVKIQQDVYGEHISAEWEAAGVCMAISVRIHCQGLQNTPYSQLKLSGCIFENLMIFQKDFLYLLQWLDVTKQHEENESANCVWAAT